MRYVCIYSPEERVLSSSWINGGYLISVSSYRHKNHNTLQTFCMLGTDQCPQLAPTVYRNGWGQPARKMEGKGTSRIPNCQLRLRLNYPLQTATKMSFTRTTTITRPLSTRKGGFRPPTTALEGKGAARNFENCD